MLRLHLILLFLYLYFGPISCQPININVRWCAPRDQIIQCLQLVNDTLKDKSLTNGRIQIGDDQVVGTDRSYLIGLTCVYASHLYDCADMIAPANDRDVKADIARFSAEQLYGLSTSDFRLYQTLAPLAVGATSKTSYVREYSTIVVKKTSNIKSLNDTRDRRACFGNVTHVRNPGYTAGWIIPVYNLQANWWNKPPSGNCTSDFQVANDLFPSGSCAPGLWALDPVFANSFSNRLCAACSGKGTSCNWNITDNDPLVCLSSSGRGDLAFVSSFQLDRDFLSTNPKYNKNDYMLICKNQQNSYADISDYDKCNFGTIPEDVYVGSSTFRSSGLGPSMLAKYVVQLYNIASVNEYASESFIADNRVANVRTMSSAMPGYPYPTPKQYLSNFGNDVFLPAMDNSFPSCAKDTMRLCVDSNEEVIKCQEMQLAFKAAGLPTQLVCLVGYSEDACMQMLNASQADLAMVDSHRADSYVQQQLVRPILRENRLNSIDYAIAVTSATGGKTLRDFQTLGRVCTAGTDSFSGWEAPNKALQQLGIIPKTCQLTEAWNQALMSSGGSCIPGANNVSVTLGRGPQYPLAPNGASILCRACGSTGQGTCKTPAESSAPYHIYDTYYGDVGALRCLSRRNGNLVFVRSSAISTVNILKLRDADFYQNVINGWSLLCSDGRTNQPFSIDNVQNCNLGVVPEKWMVARNADDGQLLRWQNAWMLAYGRARSDYDWLKTYIPYDMNSSTHLLDLIFSNNTQLLTRFNFQTTTLQEFHTMAFNDPGYINPFFCGSLAPSSFSYCCFVLIIFSVILSRVV